MTRPRMAAALLVAATVAAAFGSMVGEGPSREAPDRRPAIDASRSAAASFARLRLAYARSAASRSAGSGPEIGTVEKALDRHLRLVVEHTHSIRSSQAALHAADTTGAWRAIAAEANAGGTMGGASADLDRLAVVADAQIDRLIELLEAEDRESRQRIRAADAARSWIVAGTLATAMVAIAFVLWRLRRYRVASASRMATLRGALDEARAREAIHSRSPDRLLPAALAMAQEGIVLIDAGGHVVFANTRAGSFLGTGVARSGTTAATLFSAMGDPAFGDGPTVSDEQAELRLKDGRSLRVSRSALPDGGVLLILCDITAAVDRTRHLVARSRHLDEALDTMSQGLCLYDAEGRLMVINRRYHEIYGLPPGAIRSGMMADQILALSADAGNHPGNTVADLLDEAARFVASGNLEPLFQPLGDGRIVAIEQRPTADGGFLATYEDVTERWHAEARIAHMARHDMLTDLPNRILLRERIDGALTQAGPDRGFAVLYLDLDFFKRVNDTLGHAVGDELLRAVARRLTACVREGDTVSRLGGDEFAILRSDVTDPDEVTALARRIVEVVGAPYELSEHSVTVGVSIGISLAPGDGMSADRLLKNADVALYRAKIDGRGGVCFFEAEMDARLQARRLLEVDLRAAVAAEAFELHYQPIYDLARDRICGFEALLRWTHPVRGRVSPAEFVPLAEEIGLIVPLGEWVLRQACLEAKGWPDDLKIAVNVSPVQFTSAGLLGTVRNALERSGLAPHRLELEITENVVLNDGGATLALLHALKSLGLRVSMDDFGTGYSSLSYLRSFPFDKIKIDQSFIRDLIVQNGSGFIVRAVISLSGSMGMITTAEGVETEAQLARLREEGCDEVQGYLFSPPVPAAQLPALLRRWNGPALAVA